MKGLIINEDVWTLIEDFEPEECQELLSRLAAFHRGEEIPPMSRMIRGAFQRIVLDNGRFDPAKKAELSAKRAEAGRKGMESRWQTVTTITNDIKNNKNNKTAQEEIRKEEIRIDKNRRESEGRFAPPTIDQVQAYVKDMGYRMDAQRFVDFYSSKGWMVGKTKMKDWKAAVRGWASRDRQASGEAPQQKRTDYDAAARELWLRDLKGG